MLELRHTMTGLEMCFEEELSKLPGWRSEFFKPEHPHTAREQTGTEEDQAVEEA